MPTIPEALSYGLKLHQSGNLQQAESIYRQILAVEPRHGDTLHLLGVIALQSNQPAAAIELMRQAIAVNPDNATYHGNLGSALGAMGRFAEAAESLKQALRLQPNFVDACNNLGNALLKLGKSDEAIATFRRAISLDPKSAAAHNNLGNALEERDELEAAVASYRQALRLLPDYVDARYNLGVALVRLGKLDLAQAAYEQVLKQRANHADAHNNLGNVYREFGRFNDALACYERALSCNPNLALAHKNRGMAWLRMGDFARGWPEFEWRWKCPDSPARGFAQPLWNGAPLDGRTILLHAEQGFGDTLQFIRFAPLVKSRGGRVVCEVQPKLASLVSRCAGIDQLVERGAPLPGFELHAPLMSLPGILGIELANLPSQVPYVVADASRVTRWAESLGKLPGRKIGINWQGNPKFRGDRFRSFGVTQFGPLAKISDVTLISLQFGEGAEQLKGLSGEFQVTELSPDSAGGLSFEETAAVMRNLDLVVTSDTVTAHLAGALGVNVIVAIPFSADWRWLLERDDSPWYPSMKLIRQRKPGDWDGVFARIAAELAATIPPAAQAPSTQTSEPR